MLLEELLTAVRSALGGAVYAGTLPTSPVVATAVLLTGGPVLEGSATRYPTFQVVHRNTHPGSGSALVTNLYNALHDSWERLPNNPGRIEGVTEPGAFAYVGDRLALFSLNFRITAVQP